METLHKLLKTQMDSHFDSQNDLGDDYEKFIDVVNETYNKFSNDLQRNSQDLHDANIRIRTVLQAFAGMFFRLNETGEILEFLAGGITDFYFPSENIVGKKIQALHADDVGLMFEEAILKATETKALVELEFAVKSKGVQQYYEAKLMPFQEQDSVVKEIMVIVLNTTKKKHAEISLLENADQLEMKAHYESMINNMLSKTLQSVEVGEIFEEAVDMIIENIEDVDSTGIYIVDEEGKQAILKAHRGFPKAYLKRAGAIPVPKGYTWKTILENAPRYCPDTDEDKNVGRAGKEAGIKCYYSIPLHSGNKTVGTININSNKVDAISEYDRKLLEIFAKQLDVAITGSNQDAENKNLIIELESKNAEMERFTYTVSHDLKSPLITIKGFLGMLEMDVNKGDTKRALSDIMRVNEAADKMVVLLDELLRLSRIGRLVNDPEIIPLGKIVNDALSLVSGSITQRGVKVDVYPELPDVLCDKQRFVEIFQNLIDNAVKYMGDQSDPRIEIGMNSNGSGSVCYIKDNGMGIDPRFHERVFGLFDMLDQDSEGSGIGLPIVKRIIEQHGGRIWVESEGVGKGSTFCFNVPVERRLR